MLNADFPTFAHITTATTTQVVSRPCTLISIIFNKPVASSTVKLIDNTSGSTVNIGTITNTTDVKPYMLFYGVHLTTGLRIITDQADDITVVYQ